MGKQFYVGKNFTRETLDTIDTIESICDEYQEDGYVLTTRQVYYQLVARGMIENTLQSYKRIAGIINDAKLAGLIDWDALEDRTRAFITPNQWNRPSDILWACARQYNEDRWDNQHRRVFVIIEKEALVGVLTDTCDRWHIPLLAARGYPSGSVLREFAVKHLIPSVHSDQGTPIILHLGDHDPSGIDMSRDLEDRLTLFCDDETRPIVRRIALNMDQVEEQRPPENPAKSTDSRFKDYRSKYGSSSWELDALSPAYLNNLVQTEIKEIVDIDKWTERDDDINEKRERMERIALNFDDSAE